MGKVCTKCKIEKSEISFPRKSTGKNGLDPQCRECHSEYQKKYQKNNKESIFMQRKSYRESNKEIIAYNLKIYYQSHKDEAKKYKQMYVIKNKKAVFESRKLYRESNKESLSEVNKKWRESNKEKIAIDIKQWNKNNPEYRKTYEIINSIAIAERRRKWGEKRENKAKYVIFSQRRRARERMLPSTLTTAQWESIKDSFDNKCCYCGKKDPLTQEHFIALTKGGEYTHNNIIPACGSCNFSKHNKGFTEWYPTFKFYSKRREQKILKYLNYKNGIQQLALL